MNILIVDDEALARSRLRTLLADLGAAGSNGNSAAPRSVTEAATAAEALACLAPTSGRGWDVVLLDIAMPEGDGLDVLQALRAEFPTLPVLMLSTYPESQYAVRCIRLGAAGYLNKSADPDAMLAAVRKVAGGGIYVSATAAEALAAAVGSRSARAGTDALSHREHQVYRLLSAGHSVSEIGAQLGLAANTVSTYRARILDKTGTRNDVELALYAQNQGRGS